MPHHFLPGISVVVSYSPFWHLSCSPSSHGVPSTMTPLPQTLQTCSFSEGMYSPSPPHSLNCRLIFFPVKCSLPQPGPHQPCFYFDGGLLCYLCASCDRQNFDETDDSLTKHLSQQKKCCIQGTQQQRPNVITGTQIIRWIGQLHVLSLFSPMRLNKEIAVFREDSSNALFCHYWNTGHQISWSAACIVFIFPDAHTCILMESFLNKKPRNYNLEVFFLLPTVTSSLISYVYSLILVTLRIVHLILWPEVTSLNSRSPVHTLHCVASPLSQDVCALWIFLLLY